MMEAHRPEDFNGCKDAPRKALPNPEGTKCP
ncbi:Uncharacterised protein [Mycobacteroides abscessus subsp. bolletii]|nr:Uncharacterised protein [Mycobacteroides abscessus subsp. bolletii]